MQRLFANRQAFYDGDILYNDWDIKKLNSDRNAAT